MRERPSRCGALKRRLGLYIGLCAIVIPIYGLTVAPSLTWSHWGSDGGDFVTAAITGRVPHPPGFPMYAFLSRAVVLMWPGDPARILNCLSVVCAVGAVLLVGATVRKRGVPNWAALTAALTLAFSSWLWSQALITEVYTMAALFGSLTVYAVQRANVRRFAPWALVGLSLGLGVSTHMTVAFLAPFVVLGRKVHWRGLGVGLVAGLFPYGLLPLRGPWPQPWGDLSTVMGWVEFVSARMYWGNAFALPLADWPARLLAWASLMARQFTPLGALAAIAGVGRVWSRGRSCVLGGAITVTLASLYAIGYNSPDSWVYLVAYLPLMVIPVGDGIRWLAGREGWPVAARPVLCLVVPVLLVALNWQAMTLAGDLGATAWLDATLDALPADAVVLTDQDRHTFALWYATEAVAWRPDVSVVDRRLWGYGSYDAYLGSVLDGDVRSLEALAGRRPLCRVDDQDEVICP